MASATAQPEGRDSSGAGCIQTGRRCTRAVHLFLWASRVLWAKETVEGRIIARYLNSRVLKTMSPSLAKENHEEKGISPKKLNRKSIEVSS